MKTIKFGLAITVLVAVLVGFYSSLAGEKFFLGFDAGTELQEFGESQLVRIFLSASALLTGITFGAFHRLWRNRSEPLNIGVIREGLLSAELWRSMLAAPLVFSSVYVAAQTQPDHVVAFFFAFQTGFFTDSIMQVKASIT